MDDALFINGTDVVAEWKKEKTMKLWTYVGKNVRIELTNGKVFTGRAAGFDDEMDNESGEDSIHLDDGIVLYDFDQSQIKSIEIID